MKRYRRRFLSEEPNLSSGRERLRFGYGKAKLHHQLIDKPFIALWEYLAVRTENLYDAFSDHFVNFDNDSKVPLMMEANVYCEILNVIRGNQYDYITKRNFVAQERLEQIQV
ncbi:MAG: squalene/phytoene synthase family protein [Psychrobacillus sp.]